MYHVSAQGVDEHIINVHYYYQLPLYTNSLKKPLPQPLTLCGQLALVLSCTL